MIADKLLWSLTAAMMRKAPEDEREWPLARVNALIEAGEVAGIDVPREIAERMHVLAHLRLEKPK